MKTSVLRVVPVLVVAIAILGLRADLSLAEGTTEVARTIQKQYNAKNDAIAKKDITAVWNLRTQDYTDVSDGKVRNATELRPKQVQMFERVRSLQATSTVESVTLDGKTAVVRVKEAGTIVMPNPQTGQDVVMRSEGVWLETWVMKDGKWLTRQSNTVTNSVTLNGKTIPTK